MTEAHKNPVVRASDVYVYQFPYWKWPVVRQCFPGCRVHFIETVEGLRAGCALVLWGARAVPNEIDAEVLASAQIIRMEDGFLRSVGLGVDLIRPVSWIADATGIYYDATRGSGLEAILASNAFSPALLARALQLRERLVATGITKYNVGAEKWVRPHTSRQANQRFILVPGQVETDASLALGAPGIRSNIGLLKAVRVANPNAYVIYKPHPDVHARLRAVGQDEKDAHLWCDVVLTDVAMGDLLMEVDEVHLLTSLTGFEALMRGKRVTCYGQPFYAGWGLTTDIAPIARRTKKLTLDELVAGVLILYPLYLSRDGQRLITPELALDELTEWRDKAGGGTPWWRRVIRIFLRRINGVK